MSAIANTTKVAFVPVSAMDKANWVNDEKICPICWEDLVPIEIDASGANRVNKMMNHLTYWVNPFAKKAKDMTPIGHVLTTQVTGELVPITHSFDNTTPKIGHTVHRECAIKAKVLGQFIKCFTCQDMIANTGAFDQTTTLKERAESLLGYAVLGALAAGSIAYAAELSPDQVAIATIAGYALCMVVLTATSFMQERAMRSIIQLSCAAFEQMTVYVRLPQRFFEREGVPFLKIPLSHMINLVDGFMDIAHSSYPVLAASIGQEVGKTFISGREPNLLEMGTRAETTIRAIAGCIMVIGIAAKLSMLVTPLTNHFFGRANQFNHEHQA